MVTARRAFESPFPVLAYLRSMRVFRWLLSGRLPLRCSRVFPDDGVEPNGVGVVVYFDGRQGMRRECERDPAFDEKHRQFGDLDGGGVVFVRRVDGWGAQDPRAGAVRTENAVGD